MEAYAQNKGVDLESMKATLSSDLESRSSSTKQTRLHTEFGISNLARSSFLSSNEGSLDDSEEQKVSQHIEAEE